MFWSCFPKKHCKFLPDDVLVDILCRLPAEDLLRCEQVCRKWNCLISTPQFNNMYVNCGAAVPTIVIEEFNVKDRNTNIVFLNDWYKKRQGILRRTKRMRRSYTCKLLNSSSFINRIFSYHGLLLVRYYYDLKILHLIVNPITGVQVTFDIPHGTIVALFFHPVAKEYYAIGTRFLEMKQEFKLLRLSLLWSNEVDFERGWKKLNYKVPTSSTSPIVKTDAIYWMVKYPDYDDLTASPVTCCGAYVIVFDIKKEEFHVISHPGERCDNQILYERHMDLLEKEGVLSFYAITFGVGDIVKMQFWDIEDQYTWSRSSETIILNVMDILPFPFNIDMNFEVKLVGTINGELIISSLWRGVFAYHLRLRTLRKLEYDGVRGSHVLIHNKTTLSFKDIPN